MTLSHPDCIERMTTTKVSVAQKVIKFAPRPRKHHSAQVWTRYLTSTSKCTNWTQPSPTHDRGAGLEYPRNSECLTSVFGICSSALLARDRGTQDLLSEGLPNNQWQLEASNFFDISLARLQASVMDFASKSYPFVTGQNLIPPSPDQE